MEPQWQTRSPGVTAELSESQLCALPDVDTVRTNFSRVNENGKARSVSFWQLRGNKSF